MAAHNLREVSREHVYILGPEKLRADTIVCTDALSVIGKIHGRPVRRRQELTLEGRPTRPKLRQVYTTAVRILMLEDTQICQPHIENCARVKGVRIPDDSL